MEIGLYEGPHRALFCSLFVPSCCFVSSFRKSYFFGFLLALIIFPACILPAGQKPQLTTSVTGSTKITTLRVTQIFYTAVKYCAFYWLVLYISMVFLDTFLLLAQNKGRIFLFSWCLHGDTNTGDQWTLLQALEQSYPCL